WIYRLIKSGLNKATKNAMCALVNSKYKDHILRSLRKRANRFGFEVVELPKATQPRRSGSLRIASKKKASDKGEHSPGIRNSSDELGTQATAEYHKQWAQKGWNFGLKRLDRIPCSPCA